MADPEGESDKPATTPQGSEQATTPLTTPSDSQPTTELNITDGSLRAIGGRFDLLAEIGRGGMGIVYRARDRETNETVAIKVLKPEIAARPELIERFRAELRLARKITHKNVCRTHDLHRFGETVVIAMEYLEGESLRAFLRRYGDVPMRRGQEWARQICSGLAEAHAQGVVHRDLKPENIMIDRQGVAKVMDFGIARSLETTATLTSTALGTPAYMSPEQAEGKPCDARSDIYSLGVILYEMFTARMPFRAETPAALALKQIHETPPPPREVEPDLPLRIDRAIQRCLEKKPEKRFQSAAELEAALTGEPQAKSAAVSGEEVELPFHLARWQRSDWGLVAAAMAGLALFFPFFNRTSLAPRSRVSFDRSVLPRIAQEFAGRLGAPVGQHARTGTVNLSMRYTYLAQRAGARVALELTDNPVPYWLWYVEWENGTHVAVDHRGALVHFWRDFAPGAGGAGPSLDEARPWAEKALSDFFGRDPAQLTVESATIATWGENAAPTFQWADPQDFHGLKRRYRVRFVGREVGEVGEFYDLPAGYRSPDPVWQMLPGVLLGILLVFPAITFRRRVDPRARWRVFHTLSGFAIGAWLASVTFSGVALRIMMGLFVGLGMAVGYFFLAIALEQFVRRMGATKLLTYARVFGRGAASEPCGLAVLRGTLVGLALLGLDTVLVWAATTNLRGRLDSYPHSGSQLAAFLGSSFPVLHVTLHSLCQSLSIIVLVPIFVSLVTRWARRPALAIVLAAALAGAALASPLFNIGSVQPYHLKVLVLFVDCLLLAWTFNRYDVLTVFVAAFTFAFCWENYLLLVVWQSLGPVEEWVAFGVWGLVVLAAVAIAFQSPLRSGYRRAAAAFD